jgi:cytochrome P450/NADPH-cytochrome P450 reductase
MFLSRESPYSWRVITENPLYEGSAPALLVQSEGTDRSLQPDRSYLVGRDPDGDIVISDARISWQHAVLRFEDGRWLLADNASTNGTYADGQRIDQLEITGQGQVRLGHPADGTLLTCTVAVPAPPAGPGGPATQIAVSPPARCPAVPPPPAERALRIGRAPDNDLIVADPGVSRHHAVLRSAADVCSIEDLGSSNGTFVNGQQVSAARLADGDLVTIGPATFRVTGQDLEEVPDAGPGTVAETGAHAPPVLVAPAAPPAPPPAPPAGPAQEPLEIPYAIRWLVPNGERFANFDILNDNDSQLDYYRRFGHIYAVGIPTKKWRLVVVSDPGLLDEVADNEDQFGKRVEEINFFAQLSNSRGAGISVIGDSERTEQIRRVMLPWYSPQHQRTQLERMKEQARKLVAGWARLPDEEPVDARTWMERYSLEVSGRGACNYNFGLLDGSSGEPHPFAAAVPESTRESIARVAEPRPDFTLLAGPARRARVRRYRQHNTELVKTADALVRARQHTGPLGQQTDLLSRLVTTADPQTGEFLDAETVRDQILMHLSNGFNGPSITGAWLAHVLGTHPEVEEQLIAEIDQITGGDPAYDLQYDDLLKLTYTTQVIKETLRIYPPQPVTIRRSLRDGMLGRYRVRKNDIILVGTLAAQRDPRYWGPDAGRFDPGQFAMDRVVGRPRHAFIPFSVGRRQCMAQEVTFMMLRVVLFEIYRHYRLRPAPGSTVRKNTIVTTKPAAVPVIRLPRDPGRPPPGLTALRDRPAAAGPVAPPAPASSPVSPRPAGGGWGDPTEIPETSEFRHLVIAYGSNFGANKELAERFAERSHFQGYTADVMTLNELAAAPPRPQPWLLVIMTSTYTSNPPANATAFRAWLERAEPGAPDWRNCRYLVWGLGNTQWNAFLAFPRYVHKKLAGLGAVPLTDLGYADVGSPVWERMHADWNSRVWPVLLELSGATPTAAAAARLAAEKATAGALTSGDSIVAMRRSLSGGGGVLPPGGRAAGVSSVMRLMTPGPRRRAESQAGLSRAMLSPAILTNAAGLDTIEARVLACRELQAPESPRRTRHLEISLPSGVRYQAGDHVGICPRNDPERVERLVRHLGAAPDGLLRIPETMNVSVVPKGVVLQVRNVLTSLVDITGRPTVALAGLLRDKAADPAERARLSEIRDVLAEPDGPPSALRAAIDAGGLDVVGLLDEFGSCDLNIFEFLRVAQQLRPRYYSASSSPQIHGDGVAHLTVGLAVTGIPGQPDGQFSPMSSRYLHGLREGDRLPVFLSSADGFHLQDDVTKPMIFVCAGTGFAPMRAFLWERLALRRAGHPLAEAALFTGIRSAGLDYIYRDEIGQLAAEGVLNHVHVAQSRGQPRQYVPDRIREQGALIWRLLAGGGYAYVCGSQPVRAAVREAFAAVAAEHGSLPPDQAAAYVDDLETTARYRPDLWG